MENDFEPIPEVGSMPGEGADESGHYGSRIERRMEELEYGEERMITRIKRAIFLVIILLFIGVGVFVFRYIQMNNAAPRSYNDLQLRIWRQAVSDNPKSARNHANLGFVYYNSGSFNQAMYEFNAALTIDKKYSTAYYYIGLLEQKQNKPKQALKNFQTAAKYASAGNRFLPEYAAGQMFEKEGRYKEALEVYKRAAADKPIIWNSHYALARMYEKTGDKEKALIEYKIAAQFNPDNEELQKGVKRLEAP